MIYTVEGVERTRQWVNKKSSTPMVSYYCTLRDQQGIVTRSVDVAQKASSPAIAAGQQLEGDINMGEYGPRFKKAWTGGGGGGARGKSPAEQAGISASVALDKALIAIEQAGAFGAVPKPSTPEEHVALVQRYANGFFAWIDAKVKAAS